MNFENKEYDLLCFKKSGIEVRKKILESLHCTGGGHYGGSFSVLDILLTLCENFLDYEERFNSDNYYNRLILSKGHSAIALYCILAKKKLIEEKKLNSYGNFMSGLEGHPDMLETNGIDFSTGSLGQGISVGLGMAIGLNQISSNVKKNVWVVVGDGECQEGQVWEAAILAARYKVGNLQVVIDSNGAQEFGYKYNKNLQQAPVPNLEEKWKSFGWDVQVVDGHDYGQLIKSFNRATYLKEIPSVIIAKTKKGAGSKLFEGNPELYHCAELSEKEYQFVLKELENECSK